jgi:hypothetical protein
MAAACTLHPNMYPASKLNATPKGIHCEFPTSSVNQIRLHPGSSPAHYTCYHLLHKSKTSTTQQQFSLPPGLKVLTGHGCTNARVTCALTGPNVMLTQPQPGCSTHAAALAYATSVPLSSRTAAASNAAMQLANALPVGTPLQLVSMFGTQLPHGMSAIP